MKTNYINIGLIFGGLSREHAVSIRSAQAVFKGLKSGENINRYKVTPIYIDQWGRWWDSAISEFVLIRGLPIKSNDLPKNNSNYGVQTLLIETKFIDTWFPVLHGPNGEDGSIQGLFQMTRKNFVGAGVLGSAMAMDKCAMKAAFAAARIEQVPYLSINNYKIQSSKEKIFNIKQIEEICGYPCFVKPANQGSSLGISKAKNRIPNGMITIQNILMD